MGFKSRELSLVDVSFGSYSGSTHEVGRERVALFLTMFCPRKANRRTVQCSPSTHSRRQGSVKRDQWQSIRKYVGSKNVNS